MLLCVMADGFLLLVRVDCRLRLSRCLLVFRLELLLLRLDYKYKIKFNVISFGQQIAQVICNCSLTFLLVVVVEKGHGLYGFTVRKA